MLVCVTDDCACVALYNAWQGGIPARENSTWQDVLRWMRANKGTVLLLIENAEEATHACECAQARVRDHHALLPCFQLPAKFLRNIL